MKLSQEEINEELASLAGIIRILRQRRTQLQRQEALRGSSVDPAVRIEIEDITAQIRGHEEEIMRLETLRAEGDQPLAEVEYRVQVAEAWNTPEGRPTVRGRRGWNSSGCGAASARRALRPSSARCVPRWCRRDMAAIRILTHHRT